MKGNRELRDTHIFIYIGTSCITKLAFRFNGRKKKQFFRADINLKNT